MEAGFVELVGTLGFPIACVIALGVFVWNIYKQSVVREEKLMTEITQNRMINSQFAEIIGKYEVTLGEIKSDVKDIKCSLHIDGQ
jgi:hypothetical protein